MNSMWQHSVSHISEALGSNWKFYVCEHLKMGEQFNCYLINVVDLHENIPKHRVLMEKKWILGNKRLGAYNLVQNFIKMK